MGPRLGVWLLLLPAALLLHEESSRAAAKVSPRRLRSGVPPCAPAPRAAPLSPAGAALRARGSRVAQGTHDMREEPTIWSTRQ